MLIREQFSKQYFKELFQSTGLIFTFINTNLQLKLMSQDMLKEILVMKLEDKKRQKNNLIVCLIELILMEKNFNIFKEMNKIQRHIKKSNPKLTGKSLIDDLSKRLLELEFKSNHLIKSKCLKWIIKKVLPTM